jgi:hypothetical protein
MKTKVVSSQSKKKQTLLKTPNQWHKMSKEDLILLRSCNDVYHVDLSELSAWLAQASLQQS